MSIRRRESSGGKRGRAAGAALLVGAALLGSSAYADATRSGVLLAPAALARTDRARLRQQVEQARRKRPEVFRKLAGLRARLPEIARAARGRGPVTVVLPLRALGSRALSPMLEQLALDAPPRGALSKKAWIGWQGSLLEAIGSLRDDRARPVLEAIVRDRGRNVAPSVLRSGARALGRLGSDRAASVLIAIANARSGVGRDQRLAVVVGLGECRRARAARALVDILRAAIAAEDDPLAREAIGALGQVGNLYAWRTPRLARSGEADVTRRRALEGLLRAYPLLDSGALREAAAKAVLLISHRETRAMIETARGRAARRQAQALDALARRAQRDGLLR